ncbi:superoxide reductase [Clostridium algifaecis]|uniref:Desulfoferrodoxin n=1 Tax=Clostridium algifaecis TaxID=1472040 RepID=A0ABS4KRV7_9CLOT|nr:desulfoferrodoxin [Clostridium algifaecis]MBP2032760.1 superoxide reductase [Clostridium algifaecis]
MIEVKQVYKCEICGNIVEVLYKGGGALTCCGKPMKLIEENTVDAALEKHVPVIEKVDGGVVVKVGTVEHPMLEKHYIQWIEIHTENKIYRKYLKPGEKPEAIFKLDEKDEKIIMAREYCNLHGLWKR